jgi:hypothetical protein
LRVMRRRRRLRRQGPRKSGREGECMFEVWIYGLDGPWLLFIIELPLTVKI